jgi:nucleoside-diphosphate-sugar epimerase
MLRILIAGCGYVGIATAKLFRSDGWEVTAWTRSGEISDRQLAKTIRTGAVDLRQGADVRQNSFDCDVVVHCASSGGGDANEYRRIYGEGVQNLITAFPEAYLIFTSSTSVYGQRNGILVDENSPAEPAAEKGKILRQAEEKVLQDSGTVLRLGGIYGPGRSFLLQTLMAGSASVSPLSNRYINQVHRDDAASAIFFLARQKQIPPPRIFNVVDDAPTPRSDILRWLSAELQIPLCHFPPEAARKRGDSNKRVSNRRLRSLGWSPAYSSYREGFLRSVLPAMA